MEFNLRNRSFVKPLDFTQDENRFLLKLAMLAAVSVIVLGVASAL